MTSSALAARYATAFVDAVMNPQNGIDDRSAIDQLRFVSDLLRDSREMHLVLASPTVSTARKKLIIGRISERLGLHSLVRNFLFVLVGHRRANELPQITNAFEELLDERRGYVRVEVSAAQPLSEERQQQIAARFAQLTGRKPRLHVAIDPALIGGVITRVGSRVYDGSVRGQLTTFQRRLTAAV